MKNWHDHKKQRIDAAISRENTKLKSRQSEPQIYHHSDISHLASKIVFEFRCTYVLGGLPSGIDNLVRLIRKQHSNLEPSPSAPQFGASEKQADLHKTLSFGYVWHHLCSILLYFSVLRPKQFPKPHSKLVVVPATKTLTASHQYPRPLMKQVRQKKPKIMRCMWFPIKQTRVGKCKSDNLCKFIFIAILIL